MIVSSEIVVHGRIAAWGNSGTRLHRSVSVAGWSEALVASSLARWPRNGLVAPSVRFQIHGLAAARSTSGTLAIAKPSIGCWVRTTIGASLSIEIIASSCGRKSSGICWSAARAATTTVVPESPPPPSAADTMRASEREICGSCTSGVRAMATAERVKSSQANGPRNPSSRLARASAAALGCTSDRTHHAAVAIRTARSAPAPTSQMGGSGINQRLASSGIIVKPGTSTPAGGHAGNAGTSIEGKRFPSVVTGTVR